MHERIELMKFNNKKNMTNTIFHKNKPAKKNFEIVITLYSDIHFIINHYLSFNK